MEGELEETVRFVGVVFRHGNRTPSSHEMKFFANDVPNDNFYPFGPQGLTNEGKRLMYKLGKKLRERYKDFLREEYVPTDVEARTTDVPRTKMSLDLVLAGLYPPSEVGRWNEELQWQPIPTISLPQTEDAMLIPWAFYPRYLEEIERLGKLPENVAKAEKFRSLAEYLSEHAATPVGSVMDMWVLYNGLMALESTKYPLPEWSKDVYPEGALLEASALQYEMLNSNDLLKKFNGGMTVQKMIDEMRAVMETGGENTTQINLFSAHEVNVVGVLAALGLYEPHVPQFSSAVILELVERNEAHYVKVVRYLGVPGEFEEQQLPGHGKLCPFDEFVNLTGNVTPSEGEMENTSRYTVNFGVILDKLRWAKFN